MAKSSKQDRAERGLARAGVNGLGPLDSKPRLTIGPLQENIG
jgi:hypothetical protein